MLLSYCMSYKGVMSLINKQIKTEEVHAKYKNIQTYHVFPFNM